jgi:inner membrane protein
MQAKGHWGLALLVLSLFAFPFGINVYVISLIFLTSFLSSLPDIDLKLGMSHRTITHTILFAIIAGIIFCLLFGTVTKETIWYIIGFLAGFLGVILHLIGDLMTYMEFKPLYPFSSREVSFGWFRADNIIANYVFFILGWIMFFLYIFYNSTILMSFF